MTSVDDVGKVQMVCVVCAMLLSLKIFTCILLVFYNLLVLFNQGLLVTHCQLSSYTNVTPRL